MTDPAGQGIEDGWGARLRRALGASPDLVTLYANEDAAVYALRQPPPGSVPPPPDLTSTPPNGTPWTPLGIAAYVLYVGSLIGFELLGLRGRHASPWRRRLLRTAICAAVVAAAVVVERFVSLGL